MDTFSQCHKINSLLELGSENDARNELIKLLDYHEKHGIEYSGLVNSLIRQSGLYPYLDINTADWGEKYVYEAFKADIGGGRKVTLHREQSYLLNALLSGRNIAVSAPTSFGKSFVIDSFISIKKPRNVVIIVPTIALTDETRRRLHKKFGREYKIITTAEQELSEKNILIFPQERAIGYADRIQNLDMLVIDEFYKASPVFDKERSSSLLRAILKLGKKASQKYFLAPNISELKSNVFTADMEFCSLEFNTVFLEKYELFREIGADGVKKSKAFVDILSSAEGKTLVYAGTYANIDRVSALVVDNFFDVKNSLLNSFSSWLGEHYDSAWNLTNLIRRGVGIHNGQLHRSLSQIQVKLFEEPFGLDAIVSTSSIIEGVNTSAENVILWSNQSGQGKAKIKDFAYRNIIGRGGRMFKHFVGKIYILEPPPVETSALLDLPFPDDLLGEVGDDGLASELSAEQIAKIILYKEEMGELLGDGVYGRLQRDGAFQNSDSYFLLDMAKDLKYNSESWNGLGYLNSPNPEQWGRLLFRAMRLQPGVWGTSYTNFVEFVKVLSLNWKLTIPELLLRLDHLDIGIEKFFDLERKVTFKLASILGDLNILQKEVLGDTAVDISPFVSKVSHAFLPKLVYQLEEYGLPRMISRKIHKAGIVNLVDEDVDLYSVMNELNFLGVDGVCQVVTDLDYFDRYILKYFFDGISDS